MLASAGTMESSVDAKANCQQLNEMSWFLSSTPQAGSPDALPYASAGQHARPFVSANLSNSSFEPRYL